MAELQSILVGIAIWLISAQIILCSPRAIKERATCNADNVLRAFRASSNLADSLTFCSKYLSLPPVTTATTTVSILLGRCVSFLILPVYEHGHGRLLRRHICDSTSTVSLQHTADGLRLPRTTNILQHSCSLSIDCTRRPSSVPIQLQSQGKSARAHGVCSP